MAAPSRGHATRSGRATRRLAGRRGDFIRRPGTWTRGDATCPAATRRWWRRGGRCGLGCLRGGGGSWVGHGGWSSFFLFRKLPEIAGKSDAISQTLDRRRPAAIRPKRHRTRVGDRDDTGRTEVGFPSSKLHSKGLISARDFWGEAGEFSSARNPQAFEAAGLSRVIDFFCDGGIRVGPRLVAGRGRREIAGRGRGGGELGSRRAGEQGREDGR
jgi:hypothetical protein